MDAVQELISWSADDKSSAPELAVFFKMLPFKK
jgi:hypothetical protein